MSFLLVVATGLASAGIIGLVVLYGNFRSHEAKPMHEGTREAISSVKEEIREVADDVEDVDTKVEAIDDSVMRQEILIEGMAKKLDVPIPPGR